VLGSVAKIAGQHRVTDPGSVSRATTRDLFPSDERAVFKISLAGRNSLTSRLSLLIWHAPRWPDPSYVRRQPPRHAPTLRSVSAVPMPSFSATAVIAA
jgi:hypothetical protein